MKPKIKNISLYAIYFILATCLARTFFWSIDGFYDYIRRRQLRTSTTDILQMVKNTFQNRADYSGLKASFFDEKELPERIYLHTNNVDLESIDGGRIQLFSSSSSYIQDNENAFVLIWRDLDKRDCSRLASTDWRNISGLKLIGMLIGNLPKYYRDRELFNGCTGGLTDEGAMVACPYGTISLPLSKEKVAEACECQANYCSITLKFM